MGITILGMAPASRHLPNDTVETGIRRGAIVAQWPGVIAASPFGEPP